MPCNHDWEFSSYCGCSVCVDCGAHAHVSKVTGLPIQTLVRCYCGYGLEPGERLEDDVEDY